MNIEVYVDNLAEATTRSELRDLFSAYGNVADVDIAVDATSRRSRGFGLVTMVTPEGARTAIQALDGKAIGTCILTVCEACPREEEDFPSPNRRRSPRRRASHLF